jgi:hypothetical protein
MLDLTSLKNAITSMENAVTVYKDANFQRNYQKMLKRS